VNKNILEKFIKDIKKFEIELDHQNPLSPSEKVKYDLIYEVYEYEYLPNQDKTYIKRLRRNNIPVKVFKEQIIDENGKKKYISRYYKLYSFKRMTNEYIDKRVNSILKKKIVVDRISTTNELFIHEQIAKRVHKKKSDSLNGAYETIFDVIGLYLSMKRYYKDEVYKWNVPDHKPKKELSLDELLEKHTRKQNRKFEKHKIQKEKHAKWVQRHQAQVKRWENSKTFTQNKIYEETGLKSYWKSIGLIDPEKASSSEWCLVNTDNEFVFNGTRYRIDKSVDQYQGKKVCISHPSSKEKEYEIRYEMEKILCFHVPPENEKDSYYFFDENIEQINNELISKS
jgi:hypothetical protein